MTEGFYTEDNVYLDVLIDQPEMETKGLILVYPCIGGNTRLYSVPTKELNAKGYAVLQYNPRSHAKSGGSMLMGLALDDLNFLLEEFHFTKLPIYVVAHSAGANAVLRFEKDIYNIVKMLLIQPVPSFRDSMLYMYEKGTNEEFIRAISKWVGDKSQLSNMLCDTQWLDPQYWQNNYYSERINNLSTGLSLGSFLEDFYITGTDVYDKFSEYRDEITVLLSNQDNWFPYDKLNRLCIENQLDFYEIAKAKDHYFFGAWNFVWIRVLKDILTGSHN